MKKNSLTILILFCFITSYAQTSLPDSTVQKLKAAIEDYKNKTNSASIAVAIVHGSDIIFSDALGYADMENKIPASMDTRYPIASITKIFTATMYMQLVERNVIRLDDEVQKYIPEYKVKLLSPENKPTTLLQLATHTAGLPRNTHADINTSMSLDKWFLTNGRSTVKWFATNEEVLASLKDISIQYPPYDYLSPGDRHYSNLGYTLLGIAVERASKTEYTRYLKANIFDPLKLDHTGFLNESGIKSQVACGYWYNDSTKKYIKTPYIESNAAIYPGGMYSTAKDLSKFISFQLDDHSADAQKILSYDRRSMMRFSKIGWKSSYPMVVHEGSHLGYRSIMVVYPDLNTGWVILTNANGINFSKLNAKIREIITPVYNTSQKISLEKYAGTYRIADGKESVKVYLKDGRLYSTYLQDLLTDKPLMQENGNLFRIETGNGNNIYFEFISDEDSNVVSLNMGQVVWKRERQ